MNSPQPDRLARGGRIDRTAILSFTFDGTHYAGHPGDTLAAALLANGVRLVGRSFKYHRPRGILTAGPEEPNALVELREGSRREPNTKATTIELYDGLAAASQNRFPSLDFDIGAMNGLLSPLFVAGFYYKTFKWPASFWEKIYEPAIRRAAGMGRASNSADPDRYEKAFTFCDVLVIGSGPAGLAAALAAGRAGARVIVCEEDFAFGGQLLADPQQIDGQPGAEWVSHAIAELDSLPTVRLMSRTAVFGTYDGGTYGAIEKVADHLPVPPAGQPRQRLWQITARRAVLASGAVERPLVFPGNDRPGVMMASATRSYLNRFAVVPGRRIAVFTNGDSGWYTAFDLAKIETSEGIGVVAVIDARSDVPPDLEQQARRLGIRVVKNGRVIGTQGNKRLETVTIHDASGRTEAVTADLLAISGGWNPALALSTHLGARPGWSDDIHAFVPKNTPPGMVVAGAARGALTLGRALVEGHAAGAEAAAACGHDKATAGPPQAADEACGVTALWQVTARGKAFVDFQHDVTAGDISLAHREGYRSVELLKRYTTLGMATDQGRMSSINGQAIMAGHLGVPIQQAGTTMARPPYAPVALSAFAGHARGRHLRPTRRTASHEFALEQGASFIEAGLWLRPEWFTRPGETEWLHSVVREVRAVREAVGICDVSTLGKIDVQGPDALTFINRIYSNGFSNLKIGRARYGLMLREDGFVFDDGTVARFGKEHFVISTTTANAGPVMRHLNLCAQVRWPELDVQLTPVTDAWAQTAVAGPQSRALLQALLGDAINLSNETFPFMAVAAFEWNGLPVRLFRISFSGELAYEIAVPANYGDGLARAIAAAGAPFGAMLYGMEALNILRIEKGHVTGSEITGTTTAADLGLGTMVSSKKNFLGRTLAMREGLLEANRMRLIGFKPVDPAQRPRSGAHFLTTGSAATTANDQGYITSVAFSPTIGQWIGLGLLKNGPSRIGERMRAVDLLRGTDIEIEICPQVFIDPEGKRLHA